MPHSTAFSVYMVENLITGKRYIGITKRASAERWRWHVYEARGKRSGAALHKAIRKHGEAAFSVRTLCVVGDGDDCRLIERALISAYGTMVPKGYNLTSGGEGLAGLSFAPEVIAAMSTARKATPQTSAQIAARQRAIESNRGRKRPRDAVERTRSANIGRKHTSEARRKMSAAKKGRPQSPLQIARSAATRTGRPRSKEAIEKTRQAMIGQTRSPETKERMRQAKLGRPAPQTSITILAANQRRLIKASPGSASGIRGIRLLPNGRWEANIKIARRAIYLGTFDDSESAHAAYLAAAAKRIKELEALVGDYCPTCADG